MKAGCLRVKISFLCSSTACGLVSRVLWSVCTSEETEKHIFVVICAHEWCTCMLILPAANFYDNSAAAKTARISGYYDSQSVAHTLRRTRNIKLTFNSKKHWMSSTAAYIATVPRNLLAHTAVSV